MLENITENLTVHLGGKIMGIILALCTGINLGFLIVALTFFSVILIKDVRETRRIYKKVKGVVDNEQRQKEEA